MTASAMVTVFCDAPDCGRWDNGGQGETAAVARRGLKHWATGVPNPDGRGRLDFCPLHKENR